MAIGRVVGGFRGLTKKSLERGAVVRSHVRPLVKPRLRTLDTQGQLGSSWPLDSALPTRSVMKVSSSIAKAT